MSRPWRCRAGWVAADLQEHEEHAHLQVCSVHDRVINLEATGWPHLLMLAAPGLDRGPAAVGLDYASFTRVRELLNEAAAGWYQPGWVCLRRGGSELLLSLDGPRVSFAPPPTLAVDWERSASALSSSGAYLRQLTQGHPASTVLGGIDGSGYFGDRFQTHFPQLVASLQHADRLGFARSCQQLIGLGPGSSPTGDDLIHGALIAHHYFRKAMRNPVIIPPFPQEFRRQTTPVGAHMLEMGREGLTPEPVRQYVLALLDGSFVEPILEKLGHMGASSGYDMAVGAYLMLAGHLGLQPPP